jgi:hypothetical protein
MRKPKGEHSQDEQSVWISIQYGTGAASGSETGSAFPGETVLTDGYFSILRSIGRSKIASSEF